MNGESASRSKVKNSATLKESKEIRKTKGKGKKAGTRFFVQLAFDVISVAVKRKTATSTEKQNQGTALFFA